MPEVSYNTKLLGVVGYNIPYTLSPAIHNYSFSRLGLDAVYLAFDLSEPKFIRAIEGLMEVSHGLNFTIPYKEKIIPFLESLSEEAEMTGAVNTVFKGRGYNTDYTALKSLLLERMGGEVGGICLVLGAGGSSRAVSFALASIGCEVFVANRTFSRAQELASRLRSYGFRASAFPLSEVQSVCGSEVSVVANTIPEPIAIELTCEPKLLVDLVYKEETPLLSKAKRKGIKTIDGLEMLVKQAMESERIWFGVSLREEEVLRYLHARKLVR
jgi:shikimate 5-dehydrogenase